MSGDGHDSGIEAAEERRDEVEPGRVQQQGAPAVQPEIPQADRQGACTAVELAARDRHRCAVLAVGEKGKQGRVGFRGGATTEEIDEAGPFGPRHLGSNHDITRVRPSAS